MKSSELMPFFDERFSEIRSYLQLLTEVEESARSGPPKLKGARFSISVDQQKMLYSSVYLQLYNLVEAVISQCLESLAEAAADPMSGWRPGDLRDELRNEWIRYTAQTHMELSAKSRLERAIETCVRLIDQLPTGQFKIAPGAGGNWDDINIEEISERVGCALDIPSEVNTAAKRHRSDDMGALKLVKDRRNRLAHGSISFVECADGVLVSELDEIADAIGAYLRAAVASFMAHIDSQNFLRESNGSAGAS